MSSKCTNKQCDAVVVTENRIIRNTSKLCSINLKNIQLSPQQSNCLPQEYYFASQIIYQPCNHLNTLKQKLK